MIKFTTINVDGVEITRTFSTVEELEKEWRSENCDLPANDDRVIYAEVYGLRLHYPTIFEELLDELGVKENFKEEKMNTEIKVKTKGGYLLATDSGDIDYPGIDIEFIANNENENVLSRPRIVFEYPTDGKLRVLIWDDKDNEDYTKEIVFDI